MVSPVTAVKVGKVPYGKGVFAARVLTAGEIIGQVDGKYIQDESYGSNYGIDLGDNLSTLEPRGAFRYLNHCCSPNAQLVLQEVEEEDGTPGLTEVYVEALCDIAEGEEVRIDYKWGMEGAIPCLCGSSQCRGWIVDPEDLPALLKREAKAAKAKAAPKAATVPEVVIKEPKPKRGRAGAANARKAAEEAEAAAEAARQAAEIAEQAAAKARNAAGKTTTKRRARS